MTASPKAKKHVADLVSLRACPEAQEWAATQPNAKAAWANCEHGDWMLWLCGKLSGERESDGRKKLVLCACECARLSLPIFEKKHPGDLRVRKCIETAEAWSRGEATIQELQAARRECYAAYAAAYAAADAAYAAADAYAYAAAYAADAAYAAAYTADAAAVAAADAAYAAADAARVLKECADIVRKHFPKPPRVGKETK